MIFGPEGRKFEFFNVYIVTCNVGNLEENSTEVKLILFLSALQLNPNTTVVVTGILNK